MTTRRTRAAPPPRRHTRSCSSNSPTTRPGGKVASTLPTLPVPTFLLLPVRSSTSRATARKRSASPVKRTVTAVPEPVVKSTTAKSSRSNSPGTTKCSSVHFCPALFSCTSHTANPHKSPFAHCFVSIHSSPHIKWIHSCFWPVPAGPLSCALRFKSGQTRDLAPHTIWMGLGHPIASCFSRSQVELPLNPCLVDPRIPVTNIQPPPTELNRQGKCELDR